MQSCVSNLVTIGSGFSVGWGSNFAIPHWLWRSSLQHCHTTVWACDTKFCAQWQQRLVCRRVVWCKNRGCTLFSSRVIASFMLQFTNFCSRGNKGGSIKNLNDSVWLADPKTFIWCKILGSILNAAKLCRNLCKNLKIFVTMATRLVWHKVNLHI